MKCSLSNTGVTPRKQTQREVESRTEGAAVPKKWRVEARGLYGDDGAQHVATAVQKAWSGLSVAIHNVGKNIAELTRAVENVGRQVSESDAVKIRKMSRLVEEVQGVM